MKTCSASRPRSDSEQWLLNTRPHAKRSGRDLAQQERKTVEYFPMLKNHMLSQPLTASHRMNTLIPYMEASNAGRLPRILLSFFVLGLCIGVQAGEITGTVRAHGKEGASRDNGKYTSRESKFLDLERVDYNSFRDFVVYIDQSMTNVPAPAAKAAEVVTQREVAQKSAVFNPHVLPVMVGTTVGWPNHDEILHNVFSYSDAKPFDLGLYSNRDPLQKVTFDKPGQVDVFCSIHSQRHCIVLVMPHPFFARTDGNGNYTITNVPPGNYRVRAWHERMPAELKEVTVPEKGPVRLDFNLGIKGLPKP